MQIETQHVVEVDHDILDILTPIGELDLSSYVLLHDRIDEFSTALAGLLGNLGASPLAQTLLTPPTCSRSVVTTEEVRHGWAAFVILALLILVWRDDGRDPNLVREHR